ncbi:MAG: peptide deformylase [Arenicellales bacterium IbO2]|nr:MAG: peptide deformylase [Arenicellales bacterium IbO2]
MAKLQILQYPDPRLRQVARAVTEFDADLAQLVADMAETMYAAEGVGLAAVQVNVPKRVVVMDLSPERDALQVFINPELSAREGKVESEEGCLSVPGVTGVVERAERVKIRARDVRGEPFETDADELLAICIQHEIDHLDGRVFVDYLSRMKQSRIRKRLQKELLEAKTAPRGRPAPRAPAHSADARDIAAL